MNNIKLKVLSSDTCGCCVKYKDKINRLVEEYPIDVEYLDINKNDLDLSEYNFKGLPFTVVYIDGRYIKYFQGDMPVERIKEQIGL